MSLKSEISELKMAWLAGMKRRNSEQKTSAEIKLWPSVLTVLVLIAIIGAVVLLPFDATLSRQAVASDWPPFLMLREVTNLVLAAPYVVVAVLAIAVMFVMRSRVRTQEGFRLKVPEIQHYYCRLGAIAHHAMFTITAILSAGIIVNIAKYIVGRPRPHLVDTVGPFGFKPFDFSYHYVSFPSGHACTAAVLATLIGLWFPRLRIPAYAALALIAVSRVFVRAHYPSDVLIGFMVGTVTTLILARFLAQMGILFSLQEGQLFPELKSKIRRKIKQVAI
ncbi:phosphatase PAP2 family protein [Bacillus subtilis]|uniref:phosphatase PAP2 family protein n=1 Tax=Pseudochrobactrum asaccharolyticum TaxID=354351 RepID=UPI001F1FBDF6|nr:phosphatase PAP2 family protein [Pseudochrobactrum asaccharolyticum]MCF7645835.1 phosphatase PAP2 family protein [Pseudochrobactrum asaccharolyticum]MCF7671099.1 phosphatase PAP2 family protein [Bacillus subtilis]